MVREVDLPVLPLADLLEEVELTECQFLGLLESFLLVGNERVASGLRRRPLHRLLLHLRRTRSILPVVLELLREVYRTLFLGQTQQGFLAKTRVSLQLL